MARLMSAIKYPQLIMSCALFPCTVCPGSSYPAEKIFNIFASENEVYASY